MKIKCVLALAIFFGLPFLSLADETAEGRIITVQPTLPFIGTQGIAILTLVPLAIQARIDFAVTAVTTNGNPNGGAGGTLSYSWDFGDGLPVASGAQPNHTFLVAGTYTVTVTIAESGNPKTTVLKRSVVITDAIKSARLQTNEDWATHGRDSLFFSGVIHVPTGSSSGQTLAFDIGGIQLNFVLGAHGAASLTSNGNIVVTTTLGSTSNGNILTTTANVLVLANSKSFVKLTIRPRPTGAPFVDAQFLLRMSEADFEAALVDETITNREATRENVRFLAKVTYKNILFQSFINELFSSKQGKRGRTR